MVIELIYAELNKNHVELRIKYAKPKAFQIEVDLIKAIPGRRYSDGVWYIPLENKDLMEEVIGSQVIWDDSQEEQIDPDELFEASPVNGLDEILAQMDTSTFKLQPRPFQLIGAAFLVKIMRGILGDEMGTGKTLQSILATHYLVQRALVKKVLVICPTSLKYQWGNEITKFTDYSYTVVDGSVSQRAKLYENDSLFTIVNYEAARTEKDIKILLENDYDVIILDEAHRIKNWQSQTFSQLRNLKATYKWELTGTPMQNQPDELFSLFTFLDEGIFGEWNKFRAKYVILGYKFGHYNMVVGYKNLKELRKVIAPYILRRTKFEVAPELPPLIISNYLVEMTQNQYDLHKKVSQDIKNLLENPSKDKELKEIQDNMRRGLLTLLIEICDSPQLLNMSDSKMAAKYAIKNATSPKLKELRSILESEVLESPKFKAVIFTQFERMQRLVVEELSKFGKCTILNGGMKAQDRQLSINRFKFDEDINFLVSTDSGNYGINLPEASLLINFDLPWNPAVWAQRNGRIHRLDSKHESIHIINLVCKEGIDERIMEVLYSKQQLANDLIEKSDEERVYTARLTDKMIKKLIE